MELLCCYTWNFNETANYARLVRSEELLRGFNEMAHILHVNVFHHKLMRPYFGRRVMTIPNISTSLNLIIF
jgi:hypothetical protein